MSKILILNDFVSKGKIAGNMMEPVLSYMGHKTYFLPTALISNNFSLGHAAIHDTSPHIKNSLEVWDKLGINFDLIFIGFLNSHMQKDLIIDYIKKLDKKPKLVLDPIMADNGKLYNSLGEEKIEIYKELMTYADILTPNFTESFFLDLDDFDRLTLDNKKYLITSCEDDNGFYNLAISNQLHKAYFKKIDKSYAGTGDLIDSLFLAYYLSTNDFNEAISLATDKISQILEAQTKTNDSSIDINIEKFLYMLDEDTYVN